MIFVFGSNLAGIHGAGAALFAKRFYHAQIGTGIGRTGNAYALPTKDENLNTLPLSSIEPYAKEFVQYAKDNPDLEFKLTRVGCGLAGYTDKDIAPMFKDAPSNVERPEGW